MYVEISTLIGLAIVLFLFGLATAQLLDRLK